MTPFGPRHQAREAALQILYFWEVGGTTPDQAIGAFFREHWTDAPDAAQAFTATLVHGTVAGLAAADKLIEQHSQHWRLERLAVIDRLILRMAVWELQHEPDVAAAVVLNEAIVLARTFSGDESARFVNGVLDAIQKAISAADSR